MAGKHKSAEKPQGILRRLAKDESGNAMLIVAAGVFPLLVAVGGGIDMTRGYMAKSRLAQTCDAAALAGRKIMDDTITPTMDGVDAGSQEIDKFVDYNFPDGTFNTETVDWTSQVDSTSGELKLTLTASVPTTLLNLASIETMPVSLDCFSIRSGNNVDVVLVLDTTGSMAWDLDSDGGSSNERMNEMQSATLRFLDTMDTLRTQLNRSGLRVRVGVVPYSQTVNIGKQLMEDSDSDGDDYVEQQNAHYYSRDFVAQRCIGSNNYCGTGWSGRNGDWRRRGLRGRQTLDLRGYVARGRAGGTSAYDWQGCLEMRTTTRSIDGDETAFGRVPDGAWDIIDQEPDGASVPKWQPYIQLPNYRYTSGRYGWPAKGTPADADLTFSDYPDDNRDISDRLAYTIQNDTDEAEQYFTTATGSGPTDRGPNYGCGTEVTLLEEHSKSDLEDMVEDLVPAGGTYHHVGMYWATTLLSNQKPFTNTNSYSSSGTARPVAKYIVFMTDGTMSTSGDEYSSYGLEYSSEYGNHVRSDTYWDTATRHRSRFRYICEYAKQQGIQVHTVAFTNSVSSTDRNSLERCASSEDDFYLANSGEAGELDTVFERIGRNIGYLRVSR